MKQARPQRQEIHPQLPSRWSRWLMAAAGGGLAAVMTVSLMANAGDGTQPPSVGQYALLPAAVSGAAGGAVCWAGLVGLVQRRCRADGPVPAMAYAVLVVPITLLGAIAGIVLTGGAYGILGGVGVVALTAGAPYGSVAQTGLVAGAMAALTAQIGMLLVVSHKLLKMVKCKLNEVDPEATNQREPQ